LNIQTTENGNQIEIRGGKKEEVFYGEIESSPERATPIYPSTESTDADTTEENIGE
jgi:hypothetical protein